MDKTKYNDITYKGFPVTGLPDPTRKDGIYKLDELTVRGITYAPAYIKLENGEIVGIGMEEHLMLAL